MKGTINTLWATVFVDELRRQGVRYVVVSPGSRSTPLAAAFFAHGGIDDVSVIDERSAAFFALGLSQSTGEVVAVLCTSGTAGAHYYPAVCEADKKGVPLLVLTADRPAELQDVGASQAMDQVKMFGGHVRYSHQVAIPEVREELFGYLRGLAGRVVMRARGQDGGPVHLNVPFRKPLEPIGVEDGHRDAVPDEVFEGPGEAVAGRKGGRAYRRHFAGRMGPSGEAVEEVAAMLSEARRPMIYVGAMRGVGRGFEEEVRRFGRRFSVPVVAEVTSGLKRGDGVIAVGDALFGSSFYEKEAPDLVIRMGMAPIGWAAQKGFRAMNDARSVYVSPRWEVADPEGQCEVQVISEEGVFLEALGGVLEDGEVQESWRAFVAAHEAAEERARRCFEERVKDEKGLSPGRLWWEVSRSLETKDVLFLSAGMVLRDADSFGFFEGKRVEVFSNRGLNGIDGVMASGLGARYGREREVKTLIVLGDVAFRHDVGSVFVGRELGIDATVLVVDNGGGAIFDYLPIAKMEALHQKHFRTKGRLGPEELLGGRGVEVVESGEALGAALKRSFASGTTDVIVARIDGAREKEARERLRAAMMASVSGEKV